MTKPLSSFTETEEEYDDRARWLDDQDGGDRWRHWAACRDKDPALFFPVVYEKKRVPRRNDDFNNCGEPLYDVVEVATDEEPPYPPPEVKAICDRCPVRGRCLKAFMYEDVGIFGGTTGYQRQLLTKKKIRKRCPGCGSEDLVKSNSQKKEVCLACATSWDIL